MSVVKKKYDVAFLPINSRLIRLSEALARPLEEKGMTTCILKTALQGRELSGWNDVGKVVIPVVPIESLWFDGESNFFKYTYRTIKSIRALKATWSPPFKLLVVFMDTYAEGEALSNVCKYKGVPTLLFQEGFHARSVKYSNNLYGLACFLRARLMPRYFTGINDGLYSDYVAVWSEYGMKEQLVDMGRGVDTIYVTGNPLPLIAKPVKLPALPLQSVVLIIHQPLSPRYCSEEWENSLYVNLVSSLARCGYKVMFKPHPRCISNGVLDQLKEDIDKSLEDRKMVEYIDRSVIAEDLLSQCNALITPISVTAYTSLRMGIPTVFIKTPRISNELLISMHELNEIHYLSNWSSVTEAIDNILKDENLRQYWFKQGPLSARKLSGSSKEFNGQWLSCIKELSS